MIIIRPPCSQSGGADLGMVAGMVRMQGVGGGGGGRAEDPSGNAAAPPSAYLIQRGGLCAHSAARVSILAGRRPSASRAAAPRAPAALHRPQVPCSSWPAAAGVASAAADAAGEKAEGGGEDLGLLRLQHHATPSSLGATALRHRHRRSVVAVCGGESESRWWEEH